MFRAGAVDTQGNVFAAQEKIRMVAAEIEQFAGDIEFETAVRPIFQQLSRICMSLQLLEDLNPRGEINGTAIVGIGEAKVPNFSTTIKIGNARRCDLQDDLGKGGDSAEVRDFFVEAHKVGQKFFVRIQRVDEGQHAQLIVFVDIDPTGVRFAFAQSLYDILLEAIGLDRPCAQHGLKYEYLFVWSGRGTIRTGPRPATTAALPFTRHFRKHIDSRPDILTSLCIMGRSRVHRLRPTAPARQVATVEFFNAEINLRTIGIPSDFI